VTTSPCDEFTGSLPFHIFVVGVDADFKFRRHTQVDSSMTIIPERGVVRSRETFGVFEMVDQVFRCSHQLCTS